MKNKKKEIQEELEQIAPSLSKLKKEEVFDIPENYFSQLPDQILSQIDFSKNESKVTQVDTSPKSNWLNQLINQVNLLFQPRMAMGLAMMIILAVASFLVLNNDDGGDGTILISSAELENYVKENIDDFEDQELFEMLESEEQESWTEMQIEDEELDGYLEEIIDDIDASDLEDFL